MKNQYILIIPIFLFSVSIFSQELEVEGEAKIQNQIKIGDMNGSSPEKGMIRWNETTNDFEGYNGHKWLSLTQAESYQLPINLADHINPGGLSASVPQVSMDDNGNAIIVWRQADGSDNQIYKSEYRSGSWTHPMNLATDHISPGGQSAESPQVSMDNNGNTIIVWSQYDGSRYQTYKSEYRSGSWTHPTDLTEHISPGGEHVYTPQVSMDNNGNAIIVWHQSDGSRFQIYKSEYRSGSWTHPTDLTEHISPGGEHAESPQVSMDNNGNAIIVWSQYDGSDNQIYKSEYRSGSWTHPTDLTEHISPGGEYAYAPQVSMDDNGNAIIVWRQSDGSTFQIYKSEYRSGSWTHPTDLTEHISPGGEHTESPQVSMDDNGNAIIVWYQSDGSDNQTYKSEYRSGSWTHPSGLTDNFSPGGQSAEIPQVSMDNNSKVIIVWRQSDGTYYHIFKAEY